MLDKANFVVTILSDADKKTIQQISEKTKLSIYQAINKKHFIVTKDNRKIDTIILNNDFTRSISKTLIKTKTPIFPSTSFSWCLRSKYKHNMIYNKIVEQFF